MYFRFCGWRQICPQWAVWRHVDTAAATSLQHREGLTPLLRHIDCFVSWRVPWLAESIVQGVLGAKPAMHHWVIGGQWRRNYRDRGYIVPPKFRTCTPCTPQVKDVACVKILSKRLTLTTRLYKVRTNLYPHLRKRSDAPVGGWLQWAGGTGLRQRDHCTVRGARQVAAGGHHLRWRRRTGQPIDHTHTHTHTHTQW